MYPCNPSFPGAFRWGSFWNIFLRFFLDIIISSSRSRFKSSNLIFESHPASCYKLYWYPISFSIFPCFHSHQGYSLCSECNYHYLIFLWNIPSLFLKVLFCWHWFIRLLSLLSFRLFDLICCLHSSITYTKPFWSRKYFFFSWSECFFLSIFTLLSSITRSRSLQRSLI